MLKSDYRWHLTFGTSGGLIETTVEETHPDIGYLANLPDALLVAAALVDLNRFSLFDDEFQQLDAIVHFAVFDRSKFKRIFRRTEQNVTQQVKRVIPAIEYEQDGSLKYCFAFPDQIVRTEDRRFYREDWSNGGC